jgi:hypothetical protein
LEYRIKIPDWLDGPLIHLVLLYRRLRYGYPFRRIPLTQGKYAIVDPEDYERLNKYKWYAIRSKNTFYAGRHSRPPKGRKRQYIKMHRVVLRPPRGLIIDHINHNGLDNRKANLRAVTYAQNTLNRVWVKPPHAHSRYKGVTWHKAQRKWQVQICYNGKHRTVGYFDNELDAAKAYDEAAKKYHKEFAVLNFKKSKILSP